MTVAIPGFRARVADEDDALKAEIAASRRPAEIVLREAAAYFAAEGSAKAARYRTRLQIATRLAMQRKTRRRSRRAA